MTDAQIATQTQRQTFDPHELAREIENVRKRAARRLGGPPPGFDPEAEARKALARRQAWLEKKRAEEAARRADPLYPELQRALDKANRLRAENAQLREQIEELKKAMAKQDQARKQNPATALVAYGNSDDVKQLTKRLQVMLPNAGELGTAGVSLVAQLAMLHGLDPLPGSDHIYAWKRGNEITVTIGYKGLLHLARREVSFVHESRPMTKEEREEHGLQEDWIGYVTELYELAKARECKELGIPYKPIIGTAVWKPGDRVPTARTPAWVAKKNSLKDALRQIVTTGQRLQSALDVAANARADVLAAAQIEQIEQVDGDTWRVALTDGDAGGTESVVEGQLMPAPAETHPDDPPTPSAPSVDAAPVPAQAPTAKHPADTTPIQTPLFVDVERSDAYRALVNAEAGK